MILAALMLAAQTATATVIPPPPPLPAIAPTPLRLVSGTPIRFVTNGAIDSRSVQQGQRFALTVTDDVITESVVVVPRGTAAVGEVDAVTEKGQFGKAASLSLRPLFIELNGQRINLVGLNESRGHKAVGAAVATTLLIGGLGLLITGKNASLPAGGGERILVFGSFLTVGPALEYLGSEFVRL